MKLNWVSILIICLGHSTLAYGSINWISDLGLAKKSAQSEQKLIMVVDRSTSAIIDKNDEISLSIDNKLIPVLSDNMKGISLMDINGNTLVADVTTDQLIELLSSLPGNVNKLYADLEGYHRYERSSKRSFELAKSYQELAEQLPFAYRHLAIEQSDLHFKEVLQFSKKQKSTQWQQTATLELAVNCAFHHRYEEAINIVTKKVGEDNLELSNMALAYYTLALSYEMINETTKAEAFTDKLRLAPGGYEYVAKLKGARLAPSSY